ncbi:MBL fold metallo-hydrolase [Plastoroseomonas arctica]|uniref:MBL fold metallo-hydrolase n=1 Tax=Plastoroseomonas arctica TaxID=1509237 RepID=A0AAF1KUR7_9PROT|nr:MBL fold metallo-hydrolase [Plastoroseomonas arctica]MBR0656847.1 MBL fold metallo-hydrolase [Plastoroseomonas arctica]
MPLAIAVIPVTPFEQNCALVWDDATLRGVVIDPGGDVPAIRAAIAEHGVAVDKILLTHGHLDHAGGAADLAETLGVPILGPGIEDAPLLAALPEQGARFGLTGMRAVQPTRYLAEGETIVIGETPFEIWHCPGHTPGHLVFTSVSQGIAFVGDVIFRGSVGRTDFPYGDGAALVHAIRTKLFPLGDAIEFLCGHGPGSSFGAERRTNPYCGDPAA